MTTIINRVAHQGKVLLTNDPLTSATIDLDGYTTLQVFIPTGYNSTTLTVYGYFPAATGVSHTATVDANGDITYQLASDSTLAGQWLALRDEANVAVAPAITAATVRNMPATVFNCSKIRLVTNNAADNSTYVGITKKA